MKPNLKFNPSSMQFEKDYSNPIIIMLVTFLIMVLLFVLLNDKPRNEVLYRNEKIMQQKSPIELDTTLRHYQSTYGFFMQVKAFEKKYYADSLREARNK